MSHWGIPGPGGSMGKCAICGEDFATGVILDLMGMDSGIQEFSVGFTDQILYAHSPDCIGKIKEAFISEDPVEVHAALPTGPLKDCLEKAIERLKSGD